MLVALSGHLGQLEKHRAFSCLRPRGKAVAGAVNKS